LPVRPCRSRATGQRLQDLTAAQAAGAGGATQRNAIAKGQQMAGDTKGFAKSVADERQLQSDRKTADAEAGTIKQRLANATPEARQQRQQQTAANTAGLAAADARMTQFDNGNYDLSTPLTPEQLAQKPQPNATIDKFASTPRPAMPAAPATQPTQPTNKYDQLAKEYTGQAPAAAPIAPPGAAPAPTAAPTAAPAATAAPKTPTAAPAAPAAGTPAAATAAAPTGQPVQHPPAAIESARRMNMVLQVDGTGLTPDGARWVRDVQNGVTGWRRAG
jgi:hypothetical protein